MHLLLGAINCLSFCRLLKWHSLACTSVVLASSFSLYLSSCISHMVAHYKVGNSINSGASTKKEKKRILSHFTQVVTFTKITLTRAVLVEHSGTVDAENTGIESHKTFTFQQSRIDAHITLAQRERENFTIIETVNAILILN